MFETTLNKKLFPNPNKRSLIITPVCRNIEFHIWRLLLSHITAKTVLNTFERDLLSFQSFKQKKNEVFLLDNSKHKKQTVAIRGETPGVITYDFPNVKALIMRGILGNPSKLNKKIMIKALRERGFENSNFAREIENDNKMWFANLMILMLREAEAGLTKEEERQLLANIEWFNKTYQF